MIRLAGLLIVSLALSAAPAWATFPGRNGELVVTYASGAKYMQQASVLWMFKPRTGASRQVEMCRVGLDYPDPPSCDDAGPPLISPDGERVAYFASENRFNLGPRPVDQRPRATLRVLSLRDGFQTRAEVPVAGKWHEPLYTSATWTPDGDHLLVEREVVPGSPSTEPGVFALRLDGVEQGAVVTDAGSPDASASGDLAFVRDGDIHVMSPSGDTRRLTFKGGAEPSLSPGGRWVAFSREGQVYVVPTDGGRARRVTRGRMPVWSPNGRRLAFIRDIKRRGLTRTHLLVLTRRTGAVTRLSRGWPLETDYAGDDSRAQGLDWRPRPR